MSPKLATAPLPTVRPQPCSSKMAAEDHTGQVSPVQFKCTKKLWDEARGQPVLPCLSRRLLFDFQIDFLHDRLED